MVQAVALWSRDHGLQSHKTFQFYWICSRPIRQIEQVLNRKKSNAFSCNSHVIDFVHFVRPMNFSVVQKVGNIDMKINWKQLRAESISMQIDIHSFHGVLNSNWSDWFLSFGSSHVWVSWWSTNSTEISSLRANRFVTWLLYPHRTFCSHMSTLGNVWSYRGDLWFLFDFFLSHLDDKVISHMMCSWISNVN